MEEMDKAIAEFNRRVAEDLAKEGIKHTDDWTFFKKNPGNALLTFGSSPLTKAVEKQEYDALPEDVKYFLDSSVSEEPPMVEEDTEEES